MKLRISCKDEVTADKAPDGRFPVNEQICPSPLLVTTAVHIFEIYEVLCSIGGYRQAVTECTIENVTRLFF